MILQHMVQLITDMYRRRNMNAEWLGHVFFRMKIAVARAMRYIRTEQLWESEHRVPMNLAPAVPGHYGATLLTRADVESERILCEHLLDVPRVKIITKRATHGTGPYTLLVDSCDGSLPMLQGLLTSTIIVGMLDPDGVLIAVVIGDPISGRMWSASSSAPTTVQVITPNHLIGSGAHVLGIEHPVRVWQGDLSEKTTVFADRNRGYAREGRQVLSDIDVRLMFGWLFRWTGVLMTGGNGMHHALLANGGERVAGSITTAIGGPWDACGVLLVTQAGGARWCATAPSHEQRQEPDRGGCASSSRARHRDRGQQRPHGRDAHHVRHRCTDPEHLDLA